MEHLDIKCGHIRDMIISKEYRRKGIATKFEKEFLKWIKKKGIKWATLNVAWHNDRARKAYEKWGFTNEDTWMIKRLK
jgi:GNAT superfamily N-acetyltransferase